MATEVAVGVLRVLSGAVRVSKAKGLPIPNSVNTVPLRASLSSPHNSFRYRAILIGPAVPRSEDRRIHRTEATVVTEGAWSGIKDLLSAFGRRLSTWFFKFEVVTTL